MKQVRLARRPVNELKCLEKSINDWLTINADKTVYDIRFQPIECEGVISLFASIVYEAEDEKA